MAFRIRPVTDAPVSDARMLGHNRVVENLRSFIESSDMITPLCIAVHGEWGSGKTSVMRTLKGLIEGGRSVLFFEAWKYEQANPAMGLVSELSSMYGKNGKNTDFLKNVGRAAAYVLSNNILGINSEEVIDIMSKSKDHVDTLSDSLRKIVQDNGGGKNLVIMIDDLDRCDPDNALQVLSLVKLFLDVEGCVCVAAVDMGRLKEAWIRKYGGDTSGDGGARMYMEKLFQVRVGIPRPSFKHVMVYVKSLASGMDDDAVRLFSTMVRGNPRSIKRALNLVSYRSRLLNHDLGIYSAVFWTALEETTSNKATCLIHNALIENGTSLGKIITDARAREAAKQAVAKIECEKDGVVFAGGYLGEVGHLATAGGRIAGRIGITRERLDKDFQTLYEATNEAVGPSAGMLML